VDRGQRPPAPRLHARVESRHARARSRACRRRAERLLGALGDRHQDRRIHGGRGAARGHRRVLQLGEHHGHEQRRLGAVAGIALLGFAFHGPYSAHWEDNRGLVYRESAPDMAPDRVIHEQDCSKPIENPTANLRCK
jgi:hypothetical protein